jgi:hypothetical protein
MDGPGIESRWGAIFSAPVQTGLRGPPGLLYNGYRVFPGVKSGRGVTLTPHPLLMPLSRKGRAIPLLPVWAVRPVQSLSACTGVHFTFFTLPHHYVVLNSIKMKIFEHNKTYTLHCSFFALLYTPLKPILQVI